MPSMLMTLGELERNRWFICAINVHWKWERRERSVWWESCFVSHDWSPSKDQEFVCYECWLFKFTNFLRILSSNQIGSIACLCWTHLTLFARVLCHNGADVSQDEPGSCATARCQLLPSSNCVQYPADDAKQLVVR